jgi:hypothetical protein
VLVEERESPGGGQYLGFETLTHVPIARAGRCRLLTRDELAWWNDYHARVEASLPAVVGRRWTGSSPMRPLGVSLAKIVVPHCSHARRVGRHGTGMIGYVTLGTNDLARAAEFYDAIGAEMGVGRMGAMNAISPGVCRAAARALA